MLPEQFSIGAECGQDALRSLHKHVAAFVIDGSARSGVALIDRIADKIIVETLPQFFARFRVKAGDTLLQVRPVAQEAHDIEFAVGDHRSRLAGEVGHPQRFFDREMLRQVLFQ